MVCIEAWLQKRAGYVYAKIPARGLHQYVIVDTPYGSRIVVATRVGDKIVFTIPVKVARAMRLHEKSKIAVHVEYLGEFVYVSIRGDDGCASTATAATAGGTPAPAGAEVRPGMGEAGGASAEEA